MIRRLTAGLWAAIAVALVVIPLPPLDEWSGAPAKSPAWWPHVGSWAIGIAVVIVLGLIAGRLATRLPGRPPRWLRLDDAWLVAGLACFVTAAAAIISRTVFAGNPHLVDEMAQLVHARAFAAGRLAAPTPVPADAFLITHTWITDAGWISQYPPGQTVLFALGFLVGAVGWIGPILGGLGTVLVYLTAKGVYGRRVARAAAVLWALSAWVLFMSASYMNHVGSTTLALGAWALAMAPRHPRRWHYAAAGAVLALATATRPMDGAAAAAPLLVWLVLERRWRAIPWLAAGGLPIGMLWGWINWELHGGPLSLGYSILYEDQHNLGFHTDPWGEPFTPFIALSNAAIAIRRLHIYAYEWPIPALLPLALWAVAGRHRRPGDLIVAAGLIAAPALYFFYWHSGFFLGPRFHYAIAPFIVIGTARAWCWTWTIAQRLPGRLVRWDVALAGTAAAVVVWGAVGVFPVRAGEYAADLPSFKLHPERELRRLGVERALVLVPTSWGDRIVVDLWALGAKPGLVERAYRRIDACELDRFRRRAREARWPPADVTARLEAAVRETPTPAPYVRGWPDPTLRLRPGPPPPARCQRELARDLDGFTLYGSLAWRNPVLRDRGIVFARDLHERNPEILAHYAGWEIWRYAPPAGQPNAMPQLTRLTETGKADP